ncbi:hypothetical protein SAMN05444274_104400 [Mariniphaga anaerophila]|uniref:GLPGLI family protein n=1 Tax=Mariniphaga anaerophila TaxID=1484053 RepID=A0A1M5AMW3_9BACT|nr:hypothetical protein [Mariniphaga anaerophila]SHF31608.1 hypothetical protein SAMN05444274_104400 [Mariniphaga anaerophila]
MKQLVVFVFVTFLGLANATAQFILHSDFYEVKQAVELLDFNRRHSGTNKASLAERDIKGSPFMNDEFIEGSIYTTSKTQFAGVPLRYNIYNDQIEFKVGENPAQALATPEIVEKIEFGDYLLEYAPFLSAKKIARGFFVVLEKGTVTLYARPRVAFEQAKKPEAYQDAVPARFLKRPDDYYIRVGKESAVLIANKKGLEDIFPEHKKEVSNFIKKHKVKVNKPETLKELVQFYNSL